MDELNQKWVPKLWKWVLRNGDLTGAVLFSLSAWWAAGEDRAMFPYIKWDVLAVLFSLMLVLGGLRKLGAIEAVCGLILETCRTARHVVLFFVGACFFVSMFITNDAALLIFVPESIVVLQRLGLGRFIIHAVVMETLAANLGSTLLPSGNPQNLYLYFHYQLGFGEFLAVTLPITVISAALLYGACRLVPAASVPIIHPPLFFVRGRHFFLYTGLFFLIGAVILRLLPMEILVIVPLVIAVTDRSLFRRADWKLLLLFIVLFVGVGNLENFPLVSESIRNRMTGWELEAGILMSQFISNVPAAVLLSGYTDQGLALVAGTDIGGLGTLIASMASLISFRCYTQMEGHRTWAYLKSFTLWNLGFLLILYAGAKGYMG